MTGPGSSDLAPYIEHTLLRPDATRAEIEKLCDEAILYRFAGVCVNSYWTALVAGRLKGTGIRTVVVIGFPLGAMTSQAKRAETALAILDGADEIDMVINIGLLKGGEDDSVSSDIADVVEAADGRPVKVVIEMKLINDTEKMLACHLAVEAGAKFVKTCTGFGGGVANAHDIALMREVVGENVWITASGGVRTEEDARLMIASGANRIGTSSGVRIVSR